MSKIPLFPNLSAILASILGVSGLRFKVSYIGSYANGSAKPIDVIEYPPLDKGGQYGFMIAMTTENNSILCEWCVNHTGTMACVGLKWGTTENWTWKEL